MSEPSKLCDDVATDTFERTLLRSAELDREPGDGAARALAALGLTVPSASEGGIEPGNALPAAGGTPAVAAGASIAAKVGGIALLAAGAIAGIVLATSPGEVARAPRAVSSAAVAEPARSETPPAPEEETAPPVVAIADLPPAPAAPVRVLRPVAIAPAPAATSAPRGVSEEIALIDRARAALSAGNTAHAERELAAYDTRFADGELVLEAKLARIELHLARAEHAQARELCERFLREHPRTAYERRVRALLRRADPERTNPQ